MHRLVEEELLDLAGCVPERFGQAACFKKKKRKTWEVKARKCG